jgi:hypothetical protein
LPPSIRAEKQTADDRADNRADREGTIHGAECSGAITDETIRRNREQHGQLHRFANPGSGAIHEHVRKSARDDRQHGARGEERDACLKDGLAREAREEKTGRDSRNGHSQREDGREKTDARQ